MARESIRRATSATSVKPSERISKSRRAKIRKVAQAKDPKSIVGNGSFARLSDF